MQLLPKILKSVKMIQYYSILFIRVLNNNASNLKVFRHQARPCPDRACRAEGIACGRKAPDRSAFGANSLITYSGEQGIDFCQSQERS